MGGRLSRSTGRTPLSVTENHYKEGIARPENMNIEDIYLTLIMRLNYHRKRNRDGIELVVDTTLYSNRITINPCTPFVLPPTIDFLSGYMIRNNHSSDSCLVQIRCGTTVFETIDVHPNTSVDVCTSRLYMLMVAPTEYTRWNIYVGDHDGVDISCKCGILHNSIINLYTGCIKDYVSTNGVRTPYSIF
jgi:hypothetical protein